MHDPYLSEQAFDIEEDPCIGSKVEDWLRGTFGGGVSPGGSVSNIAFLLSVN